MPSFKTWWERSYSGTKERVSLHFLFWLAYLCFLSSTAYEHLRISSPVSVPPQLLFWLSPLYLVLVYYFFIRTAYVSNQRHRSGRAWLAVLLSFVLYMHGDILFTYLQAAKLQTEGIPSKIQIE